MLLRSFKEKRLVHSFLLGRKETLFHQNSLKIHRGTSNCSPRWPGRGRPPESFRPVALWLHYSIPLAFFFFFPSFCSLTILLQKSHRKERSKEKNEETLTAAFPPPTLERAISPDEEQSWKDSALFFCQKHLKKHLGSCRTGCLFWIGLCAVKDNWYSSFSLFPTQQWFIKAEKQRKGSDLKGSVKYFTFLLAGKIKYDTSHHQGGCFWLSLVVLGFGLHLML